MKTIKLPQHLITNVTISREVENQSFDFTVTFSIYGEVLDRKNHFLELPATAQKLMYGDRVTEFKEKSKRISECLRYEIPMIVTENLSGKSYEPIFKKWQELVEVNKKSQSSFFTHLVNDKWTKEFLKLNQQAPRPKIMDLLAQLIQEQPAVKPETLRALLEFEVRLCIPILLNLIPNLTDSQAIKYAYQCLGKIPDESVFLVLAHRLQDEKQKNFHAEILMGLRPNRSQELRQLVINYHKHNQQIVEEIQLNIVKILSEYPDEECTEILEEYFMGTKEKIAYLAYNKLVSRMPLKQLAALNEENYKNRKSVEHVHTALFQYVYRLNARFLPSSTSLIETLKWVCEENGKEETYELIANVLSRKARLFRNISPLKAMLVSDKPNYKLGALYQYKELGSTRHLPAILKVLKQAEKELKTTAIYTVNAILKREKYKKVYALYMTLLAEEPSIKREVISGIIYQLEKKPNPVILPLLIKEVKDKNSSDRSGAAHALRYFSQLESVEALKELENDKDIGDTVSDSLDWIENPTKAKLEDEEFVEFIRKRYAEYYQKYEE